MTPSGIEPETFRFVAQHLNHCATAIAYIPLYVTLIRQDLWIWKSALWRNRAIITYDKQYKNLFGGKHRGTNGKVPKRCRNCNDKCGRLITDNFHCRTACVRPWTAARNPCEHFPYFCHHSYLSFTQATLYSTKPKRNSFTVISVFALFLF